MLFYVCLASMFLVMKSPKKVEPREKSLTLVELESHDLSVVIILPASESLLKDCLF